MAIILLQQFNDAQEERVLGDRAHSVIGDTCWRGAAHPRGVSEEGIQAAVAALILLELDVRSPRNVLTSSRSM